MKSPVRFECRLFTFALTAVSVAILGAGCGKRDPAPDAGSDAASAPTAMEALPAVATPQGDMIHVPAGEFVMGDARGSDDEKPVRTVTVDAFLMDRTEVTQKSYQAVMGRNPSRFKGEDRPVEQASWFDAIRYCNMRSRREGLTPAYDEKTLACDFEADGYRLPTEAEWEYACRAGATTRYGFGDRVSDLGRYAWFKDNAGDETHPVGRKEPNIWGLYDMHGNVAEWVHDVYEPDGYANAGTDNPTGPDAGEERVLRGGSWNKSADACRAAVRDSETPRFSDVCFGSDNYGFRAVRKP